MPVRVQGPDGQIHEFPDPPPGMKPDEYQRKIDGAMAQTYADDKPLNDSEWQQGHALNVLNFGGLLPVGDEIVGGISGAGEFLRSGSLSRASKAYNDEVKHARGIQRRYDRQIDQQPFLDENYVPTGRTVSDVLGFVASAPLFEGALGLSNKVTGGARAALGYAPQAAGLPGRILQGGVNLGLTGAAGDAAYRFANAEGGLHPRLNAVEEGGIEGPALAATLGVAAGGLGEGGVRTAQWLGKEFLPASRQAARYVAEKLGTMTPEEFGAEQQVAARTGKPVALSDVGPSGIRNAAGEAARAPGPGRDQAQEVLGNRQAGQVERVSQDVGDAAGGDLQSFTKTTDDIQAARAEQAKPLYDQAMSQGPLQSPKLTEIVNRPSAKAAMQRGLKIAQDEGVPMEELVTTGADGQPAYSTKALHYMKMGLDDMIASAQRTGDLSAARAYSILKNQLLSEMDRLNPAYAQARSVFAGHSANQNALEAGRAAFNKHPDQIAAEMGGMGEGEREFYRRGFAQRVIEEVERSPDKGNAVNRIFGNTAKRNRMKAVLGEQRYNELAQKLSVEQGMYETFAAANVGSQTAERQAEAQSMDEAGLSTMGKIGTGLAQTEITGYPGYLIRQIGLGSVATLLRSMRQGMREHIAKLLFSQSPEDVREAVRLIRREYNILHAQKSTRRVAGAMLAGAQGSPDAEIATVGALSGAYQAAPVHPF